MNKKLKISRIIVSTIIFICFVVLFFLTNYESTSFTEIPTNIFLKLDSFAVITSSIASRVFDAKLLLTGSTLLITTLIFGRFFCSWICPLGYINQIASNIRFHNKTKNFSKIQYFKYYFLAALVILSIFGIGLSQIFDPISIIERTFAFGLTPVLANLLSKLIDITGNISSLSSLETNLKNFQYYIFPSESYYFNHAIPTLLFFLAIILFNLVTNRFWCNYICPLGALLGAISNFSIFKVRPSGSFCKKCENENDCRKTHINCHGNANPYKGENLKHSECMVCGNCIGICPSLKLSYKPSLDLCDKNFQPDRRYFLLSSLIAVLFGTYLKKESLLNKELIRPPGAIKENLFISKCINCGKCTKVCPNNAIQLTFLESKLEDILTPHLIPRMAYCEYYCNSCSQVCPTKAIKPISMDEKLILPIGLAEIDKNRCIAYRYEEHCLICEQVCPVPEKAIKISMRRGIGRPVMDNSLCIGCGKCEYNCPVGPDAAIVVNPEGAKRLNP